MGGAFSIGFYTGQITVNGLFDYNTISNYTLLVEVWNILNPEILVGGVWYGPHVVNTTVTINVIGKLHVFYY